MLKRHPENPILTRTDIPDLPPHLVDVTSVFNPGAIRYRDQVILILRVQNRGRETYFYKATSSDAIHFEVAPAPIHFDGIENVTATIYHGYDARITNLEGTYYLMFALDMETGCRLGLARTVDFVTFQFMGLVSEDDSRNGVLFPEKVTGKYHRLDRPNQVQLADGPRSGNTICLSESTDLLHWQMIQPVMSGRFHYWDELIGAGPIPIKTEAGWLQIYHGVATHFGSSNIYQAGVALLDLENPGKVLNRGRYNILEPRELYELTGQVPNVVFPSGAVVENVDARGFANLTSPVYVYYGAADTCVGLAITTIHKLIDAARLH
ncbi:glycoside hydrolase family 130 protein [candidate division KSB1 bacterium]|nr:glycoside hydrolase family 130 protein [candidate division KSB1 bacterium]